MSFSIDHILHCMPVRPLPVKTVPQLNMETYYRYCLNTLASSFLPLHNHVLPTHLAPQTTSQLPRLSNPPPSIISPSPVTCTDSGVDSDSGDSSTDQPSHKTLGQRKSHSLKKKSRTIFTTQQLKDLEKYFGKQKYLSKVDRCRLASSLGLNERQVKTWYQNRRTRWKKDCSDKEWSMEKELSATNNYSQYVHLKTFNE